MEGFKRDSAEKGWRRCKNPQLSGEKVEKTESGRTATERTAVSEKKNGVE